MSFLGSDKKPRFDLVDIGANTSKYRVNTLVVDDTILSADIEVKTWYGGWKRLGSLLAFVNEAKLEIEKCETKLKGAKAKHVQAYQDLKVLLQMFDKKGCLYGEVSSTTKSPPPPSVDDKFKTVGPKADPVTPKPKGPVMSLTMSSPAASPQGNNQQKGGTNKPGNNNSS